MRVIPIIELPGIGSYNDIAASYGYSVYHNVLMHDSLEFKAIAFVRRTKIPIFVQVEDESKAISYSDVIKGINSVNWDFEIRQLDFEDANPSLFK